MEGVCCLCVVVVGDLWRWCLNNHVLFLFMSILSARLTSYHSKNKWHLSCSNLAALMNLRAYTDPCFLWILITTSELLVSSFYLHMFSLILVHCKCVWVLTFDTTCAANVLFVLQLTLPEHLLGKILHKVLLAHGWLRIS
jgi:hypothetical protein